MAGGFLDPTVFRADGIARLSLKPIEFFLDPDRLRESLPRVSLFRPEDLLNVRLSFVDLILEEDDQGRILRRADGANVGYLRVLFSGQHLHEIAFFEKTAGVEVGHFKEPKARAEDRDLKTTKDEDPQKPPVRTRIAGASKLVFQVREERIPYTQQGILSAIGMLPLSVAPHAVRRPLPLRARKSINDLILLQPAPLPGITISGALQTTSRMLGAAAALQARFGMTAASSAVIAASAGSGTFHIDPAAVRTIASIIRERLLAPVDLPPAPREPSPVETAIELPWRLHLSPHAGAGFAHSAEPAVSADGRVELWHTRLGTQIDRDNQGVEERVVDEGPRDDRTVRAVWARDYDETPGFTYRPGGGTGADYPNADQRNDVPNWRSPLNSRDRMMLVHETSNFQLDRPRGAAVYRPPSVDVDRLMLSAMGGWLNSRFQTAPPEGSALTIEEWVHRAALGRDYYVKVVYKGFLMPFLHPASLVKITERKIRNGIAYLFQRMFVVVREPQRAYGASGDKKIDRSMPFSSVRMLTLTTPDIDPPNDLTQTIGGYMFIPKVDGRDFRFRMIGIGIDGRMSEFDGPLIFAEFDHNQQVAIDTTAVAYNANAPTFNFRGQKIAYAPSATADDTTLATQSMIFNVVAVKDRPPAAILCEPMLRIAATVVPAMSVLAGGSAAATVEYPPQYLENLFAGNAAEIFLQLKTPSPLNFSTQSDRSGGFVAPSIDVTALSRTLGPVGGPVTALMTGGPGFDPASFFPSSAKLFGLVSLQDLVPKGFGAGKLPRFIAQSFDVATMFTANLEQVNDLAGRLATAPEAAGIAAQLQGIADTSATLLQAVAALVNTADGIPLPDKVAAIGTATGAVGAAIGALPDPASLLRSDREVLQAVLRRIQDQIGNPDLLTTLQDAASGATLPETVRARLDWTTKLQKWPAGAPSFIPRGSETLTLAVEVQAPSTPGGPPSALVSCAISAFDLVLIGPVPYLTLSFEKLEFSSVPGQKTDVNVVFSKTDGVKFGGPLSFVETLREIIPFDGFSDPPYLDVSAAGIRAGFDIGIPTIAMGIFALSNVTFSAAFELPFIGESIAVRFAFSSREDPFRLQVAFFAGGGFFAITITPKEVRQLEAALEFGAAVALNFGVASGSVSVMAGIYFCLRTENGVANAKLTGYFRARGEVDVLGLITASVEIYLELTYETASGKAVGRASIWVEVSVCMLSFSVSISCEKKFAGSSGDPTFEEVMGLPPGAGAGTTRPWDDYCDAFAD